MKFWKCLSILIEDTLPEWRDKFLSYKDLKKQLKLIYPKDGDKPPSKRLKSDNPAADRSDCSADGGSGGDVTKEVVDFVRLLEDEMEKLNSFIVEKEEDSVIKWRELQDRAAEAKDYSRDELMRVGREIVDLHGEMILLENYSALNYTGLVKILKKYDKRSGALLRVPFIRTVMQQPFFTTHMLNMLVKECESTLDNLFSGNEPPPPPTTTSPPEPSSMETMAAAAEETSSSSFRVPNELNEIENMESMYMKQTLSALRVLKEIRSGSSTVNMFSLPPLEGHAALEEEWKNLSVLEQAAK